MDQIISIARFLLIVGILFVLLGGGLYLIARFGIPIGSFPGDLRLQRGNFTCIVPLATSLLISIILTIILNILGRGFHPK
jgi:hypothetical protein